MCRKQERRKLVRLENNLGRGCLGNIGLRRFGGNEGDNTSVKGGGVEVSNVAQYQPLVEKDDRWAALLIEG